MAASSGRILQVAGAARTLANDTAELLTRIHEFLEHNSDQAIDWGGSGNPAAVPEDGGGYVTGYNFTRANVSNAIGSFDNIRKLLTNQVASQGDHLGNINQLADA